MKKKIPQNRKAGQPPKYTEAEKLAREIDVYFEVETQPTLSGLAYFLHMDRKTLFNYSKTQKFFPIIKRARDRIYSIYEKKLIYSNKNAVGVIFALKNMDWRDKSEVDTKHSGNVTWTEAAPK